MMANGGVQIYGNASPAFVVGQLSPAMLQSNREVLQQAYLRQTPSKIEVQSTLLIHAIAFIDMQMPQVQY